jgi:hypothetical protein
VPGLPGRDAREQRRDPLGRAGRHHRRLIVHHPDLRRPIVPA